jgi:RND family efflux transporter MFP subunit
MTRRRAWLAVAVALLAVAALGLGARAKWGRPAAGGAASGAAATAAAPATAASAAAIDLAPGDVATAQRSELVQLLAISGSLKAVDSAVVKARVAAEVKSLSVREGDRVEAGQLIGRLDTTEFDLRLRQAEDQAASAQAQLDIAERALENNRALVGQGFISKNALDTSVSNAAAARASLQAARAAAELSRKAVRDSEIRAPIAGLVSQRLVQPGERVPIDTRLVEIVDLSRIELEAAVAPEDVLALRVGQLGRVQIDGLPQPLPARVVRINPSAQTGTRSVMAYLRLEPHPALRQGLFARATIELQRQPALVVPVSALRLDQARPYVLAVESGKAVARTVTTGGRGDVALNGGTEAAVEITAGLAEGSLVLRGAVGNLRAGTLLRLPAAAPAAAAPAAAAMPAAASASASATAAAAAR